MMLILNTHAKLEKDISFDKSVKHTDMMERLDYLYGKDRMMSFNKFDIHLLSADEMRIAMEENGGFRDDMFVNTMEVSNKIEDYTISRNLNLLPVEHRDPDKEIRKYAESFLEEKGLSTNQEYVDRLNEELDIIKQKKFASYFIVVQNMVQAVDHLLDLLSAMLLALLILIQSSMDCYSFVSSILIVTISLT